jgi:hypothetical protein
MLEDLYEELKFEEKNGNINGNISFEIDFIKYMYIPISNIYENDISTLLEDKKDEDFEILSPIIEQYDFNISVPEIDDSVIIIYIN